MTASEVAKNLKLDILCLPEPEREVTGAYIGDLLSWVMGRAKENNAWITIMSNINVIAVASLSDVGCVILAEGVTMGDEERNAAESKGINILLSKDTSYEIAVKLSGIL